MSRTTSPADQIRQTVADTLADLRARRDLSPEGLQRQISRAYLEAKAAMKALADSAKQQRDDTADALARRLFGTSNSDPAAVLSTRDAWDRATRLASPADAAALAQLADQSSDHTLLRAVAQRAYAQLTNPGVMGDARTQWRGLLNEWAERSGNVAELAELDDVQSARDNLFEYTLARPTELDRISGSLEALAEQADALGPERNPAEVFFGRGGGVPEAG
jgi:hypothetical protein